MAKSKKKQTKTSVSTNDTLVQFIVGIAILGFSLIAWFRWGIIGAILDSSMRVLVGQFPMIYYGILIVFVMCRMFKKEFFNKPWDFWVGVVLLFLTLVLVQSMSLGKEGVGLSVITDYAGQMAKIFNDIDAPAYSGMIGAIVYGLFSYLLGREGVVIFAIIFFIIGIVLVFTYQRVLGMVRQGSHKASNQVESFKLARNEKKAALKSHPTHNVDAMIEKNFSDEPQPKVSFVTLDATETKDLKSPSKDSIFMDANFGREPEDVAKRPKAQMDNHEMPQALTQDAPETDETKKSGDFKSYKIPPVTLLEQPKGSSRSNANAGSAKHKADRLLQVLRQFGIEATLIDIHIGPAVTKFELKPDSNVKISKISSISDNLMMELAVKTLRIEAPIPGKTAVGIEIPNIEMIPVKMRDVIQNTPSFKDDKNINVALGKDLMGNPITVALNKMPHLLVAGATGSGKSVCMNSIITSIILTKTPEELKLLLIDPKKVEFTPYMEIPHLIGPVINDPLQASMALKVVVDEMDNRYDLFSKAGVRNISSYNEKVIAFPEENRKPIPWIVVIIDELADLMSVAGKDVEISIQRITQLARAAGIHLIVATQRPSVDVVTGIIKANIPSRIAFAVSSAIDSRTILDATGAEKLLGYGDMLYIPMGEPNPTRVQGCYVSDEEVRRIAEKSSIQAKPHYDDAFIKLDGVDGNHGIVSSHDDPLFEEAVEFVTLEQKASTSLLQRRFKVGYNRAANLIDALEQNGIIGPPNGSKPRDVFRKPEMNEEDTF